MKPLVFYKPKAKQDSFEGARLRKSIKGALEMHSINYVTEMSADFDVAHFISRIDEAKLIETKEKNIPLIASAFYCEFDPSISFFNYKYIRGKRTVSISNKSTKFLSDMDLVLVPSKKDKNFLIENGVTTSIDVLLPGVNLTRFDFSRNDEKEIFYRYFKEDKRKKLVVAVGEYTKSLDGLHSLARAARLCPDAIFYVFCSSKYSHEKLARALRKLNKDKNKPTNLHYQGIVTDDVYRSALLNASIFVVPGYSPFGVMSLMDAMAAKCQIIARKQATTDEIIVDRKNGYLAEFSETIVSLIQESLQGKLQPTIHEAYNMVKAHDLNNFGKELIAIYKREIARK